MSKTIQDVNYILAVKDFIVLIYAINDLSNLFVDSIFTILIKIYTNPILTITILNILTKRIPFFIFTSDLKNKTAVQRARLVGQYFKLKLGYKEKITGK